ncbi:hypothetical protein CAPTEDRAFT_224056 [Capitella teleta]|uniref:Uncharacterized protein n=1 Tax=Capitella teleta TaxID=283909 RepID=R7T4K1_CAPTE|nr:hypothetical protein CAPTEDRAFT_224056 [Capitella teleta]|eukprot:ELT87967.1 hypothetical protein CAPTEDRAFT_224056 [Capitella teleta]
MSLDRVCSYSTIIFAMNVWVLLVVSIATDYWEYRGFQYADIRKQITPSNTTQRYHPSTTTSHFVINYFWEPAARSGDLPSSYVEELFDQPPSLVRKIFVRRNVSLVENFGDVTVGTLVEEKREYREDTVLYFQHGNLFRDCDDLGVGVRVRLGLIKRRPHRCFNFILNRRPPYDYLTLELSAVIHLERSAFVLGIASVLSATLSVAGGCFGCLMHDKSGLILASAGAVGSAVLLILCIAVFHAKCHLIHRHEFMQGIHLPYKRVIDASRTQRFGWSFLLAWLCVGMLLVQAYVWLNKAQNYGIKTFAGEHFASEHAVAGVTRLDDEHIDLLSNGPKNANGGIEPYFL